MADRNRDRPQAEHAHQYQRRSTPGGLSDGTPHAVKQRVEYNLLASLIRNLIRTALIALVPTIFIVGSMIGVWLSTGIRPVHEAAKEMRTAQINWYAALQEAHPVINALGANGAPLSELEKVYFAFVDSPDEDRAHQADVLLQVLEDQARTLRSTSVDTQPIYELLQPVSQSRFEVTRTYERWLEAMRPAPSRAAVILKLAPAPTESDARYAQDAARDI